MGYFVPGGTDTKLLDKAVKILADKLVEKDVFGHDVAGDWWIEDYEIKEYPDFLEAVLWTNIEINLDDSSLDPEELEDAEERGIEDPGAGHISKIILRINPAAFDANLIDVDTKANLTQLKNIATRIILRLAYLIRKVLIYMKDDIDHCDTSYYAYGKDPLIKLQHFEVSFYENCLDDWNWTSHY